MRATAVATGVRRALDESGTPSAGDTLVVGLSGGADSVALTEALATLAPGRGFGLVAAHLDHGLRAASAEDARFCQALCERQGLRFRTASADVRDRAARRGEGLEEAARSERYAYLRRVAREEGAVAIAVGHTRDDQAETFLLRLLRGSGGAGLASMGLKSGDLLRPLLRVSRAEVLAHLSACGLTWREDSSNADCQFARNRVRHELIPYLESRFNPRIREILARSAGLLRDESEALAALGRELLASASRREGGRLLLSTRALRAAPRAVARLALRQAIQEEGGVRGVGGVHVDRLLDLGASRSASGRRLPLPGHREAVYRFGEMAIGPQLDTARPFAFPLPVPGDVELPGGRALSARPSPGPAASKGWEAVVPVPDLPLEVRTRRPGDRVRTHGREVSLRRFLMARRVPADLRPGLPLVAAGRRVVWVPGQAIEDCGEEARRFVRLEIMESARS